MSLLGDFIQQNPNMFNQLQPPMTSVNGGLNSFPNAGAELSTGVQVVPGTNPGGQFVQPTDAMTGGLIALPDPSQGMNKPRRPDPFGNILPDQGFQNLPGANQGINLPISIGNNPSLNPIQDQMFRPPMQPPVQNQMPNSFLDQLQQSAGLLNGQIRNVVPQNKFVGNEFQMPYNFDGGFGSTYNPGNFNYTPQPFNQYGNVPVTGSVPSNIPVNNTRDPMGRDKDQGADGVRTEIIGDKMYRIDETTGQMTEVDPDSADYKFNNFMSGLLSKMPMQLGSGLLGLSDPLKGALERLDPTQRDTVLNDLGLTLSSIGLRELESGNLVSTSDYNLNNPFSTKGTIKGFFGDDIDVQSSGYNATGLANVQSQKQKLAADMAKRQGDKGAGEGKGGETGDAGSAGDRSSDPSGFGGFGAGADQ